MLILAPPLTLEGGYDMQALGESVRVTIEEMLKGNEK